MAGFRYSLARLSRELEGAMDWRLAERNLELVANVNRKVLSS